VSAALVRLALRRTLAPSVCAASAALLALLLSRDWAGPNALLEAAEAGTSASLAARGLLREGVWTLLALTLLPLLVARAARTVPAWRAGEGEWLGSRAAGRGSILASTWIGTFAGGAILLLLAALAVELRAAAIGPGAPTLRRGASIPIPSTAWIGSGAPLEWTLADPRAPAGARARLELGFGMDAGSTAEVELRAARAGGREHASRARIGSRGSIEVLLPEGPGDLRFELRCTRPGTRAYVASDEVEVWIPCAGDAAASAAILVRLLLAHAVLSALAIGLSAWISAPTAVLALLAAWCTAWLADRPPAWLPGADLFGALDVAGAGRVPAALDPLSFAAGAVLSAAGLLLAARGISSWRGST